MEQGTGIEPASSAWEADVLFFSLVLKILETPVFSMVLRILALIDFLI